MTRRPDTTYIRPLSALDTGDVEKFGGKTVALGEMIRRMSAAGLSAPKGFAVSTRGYERFLLVNGIKDWITELLGAIKNDGSNIPQIAAAIRASIRSSDVPGDLRREIDAHYRVLLEDVDDWPLPVAVLISATPERLAATAFGGRPPALLFVQNAQGLIDALRKSYAAAFSERAIAHRHERHLAHDAFQLSVAVQSTVWTNAGDRPRDVENDDRGALTTMRAMPLRQVG